jgi:hypothetical protein
VNCDCSGFRPSHLERLSPLDSCSSFAGLLSVGMLSCLDRLEIWHQGEAMAMSYRLHELRIHISFTHSILLLPSSFLYHGNNTIN